MLVMADMKHDHIAMAGSRRMLPSALPGKVVIRLGALAQPVRAGDS